MSEASLQALEGLRDLSTLKWYVIPLLAIVFYIYATEIRKARVSKNWDAVIAGLTLFGMDFFNETWNGWLLNITGRSAAWTAPGETALRTMVGWNIEIMFMFLISGIIYYYTLSPDKDEKILGLNNRWFWAIGYALFCLIVEIGLNIGGHLIWEYALWQRTFMGVWLIFLFGYFHFYVAIILVLNLKSRRKQWIAVGSIYALAVVMNIFGATVGWVY